MSRASDISFIVPAAGRSARMGAENKLLLPLGRRSVLERVVMAVLDADPLELIVVTGAERERVEAVLAPHPVHIVYNPDHDEGMGSSLRAGVAASSRRAVGFAIMPADLPFIRPETIIDLCTRLPANGVVVPHFEGRQGHPVVFANRFRDELTALTGDVGARGILQTYGDDVLVVDTDDPGVSLDLDTMDAYRRSETL